MKLLGNTSIGYVCIHNRPKKNFNIYNKLKTRHPNDISRSSDHEKSKIVYFIIIKSKSFAVHKRPKHSFEELIQLECKILLPSEKYFQFFVCSKAHLARKLVQWSRLSMRLKEHHSHCCPGSYIKEPPGGKPFLLPRPRSWTDLRCCGTLCCCCLATTTEDGLAIRRSYLHYLCLRFILVSSETLRP